MLAIMEYYCSLPLCFVCCHRRSQTVLALHVTAHLAGQKLCLPLNAVRLLMHGGFWLVASMRQRPSYLPGSCMWYPSSDIARCMLLPKVWSEWPAQLRQELLTLRRRRQLSLGFGWQPAVATPAIEYNFKPLGQFRCAGCCHIKKQAAAECDSNNASICPQWYACRAQRPHCPANSPSSLNHSGHTSLASAAP